MQKVQTLAGGKASYRGKDTPLIGTNWTIIGSPGALEIARQAAVGGSLQEQPEVRS